MNLPEVERAEAVRVEPGDIIVLTVAERLSDEVRERIRGQAEQVFPGHRCLVLSGLTLEVVRPENLSETTEAPDPLAAQQG